MRPIILLLAIFVLLDLTQCSTPPRVNWPAVAQCGTAGVSSDLFQSIAMVLVGTDDDTTTTIGDRAIGQLEELARVHGPALVTCLIDQAVHGFDAQAGRSSEVVTSQRLAASKPLTLAQLGAARGRDFLARVAKARVEQSQ